MHLPFSRVWSLFELISFSHMEPICHPDVHLQPGSECNESSTRKGILSPFWSHCLTPWTKELFMRDGEQDTEEYKQKRAEFVNTSAMSMTCIAHA